MTPSVSIKATFGRWLRFNAVGLVGVGVQIAVLALLARGFRWNVLLATALAVEAAVIHNYLWHERFTWRDRGLHVDLYQRFLRFLRFNIANGAVSLFGNVVLMYLFAEKLGIPLLRANLLAIGCCALVNFFVSDRFVFIQAKEP